MLPTDIDPLQKLDGELPKDMQYVTQHKALSEEPVSNWTQVEYYMPRESFLSPEASESGEDGGALLFGTGRPSLFGGRTSSWRRERFLSTSLRESFSKMGNTILMNMIMHSERPTELHSVHDLECNEVSF